MLTSTPSSYSLGHTHTVHIKFSILITSTSDACDVVSLIYLNLPPKLYSRLWRTVLALLETSPCSHITLDTVAPLLDVIVILGLRYLLTEVHHHVEDVNAVPNFFLHCISTNTKQSGRGVPEAFFVYSDGNPNVIIPGQIHYRSSDSFS